MGLSISKNNEESPQSINWDNLNTEDMSSTMPPLTQISYDAEKLVSNLTIINNINYENTESEEENIFTWLQNIKENKNIKYNKVNDQNQEMVQKDMFEKEIIETEVGEKEMVEKEMVEKEMVEKEMVEKEIVEKEMVEKEMVEKEMVEKEMVDNDVFDNEVFETIQPRNNNINKEVLSDTSPFISSEAYRYLIKKKTEDDLTSSINQRGGMHNSTSDTSSSSTPQKVKKSKKSFKNLKKSNKYPVINENSVVSSSSDHLSYISSSAHTDTTLSINNNKMLSSSVNTSDIRLVSE